MELPLASGRWKGVPVTNTAAPPQARSLFFCLLPYIEQDNLYKQQLNLIQTTAIATLVKTYVSPADFTGNGSGGQASYACNWQLFNFEIPPAAATTVNPAYTAIPRGFPDGTTNVIMFAEIYQLCNTASGRTRFWSMTANSTDMTVSGTNQNLSVAAFNRLPTVSAAVLSTDPGFQVAPRNNVAYTIGAITGGCNPALAQTPHSGGMLVCLGDASVRSVQSSLSPLTWQRAITPADGNVLPSDW
jgi:hypothetical protein